MTMNLTLVLTEYANQQPKKKLSHTLTHKHWEMTTGDGNDMCYSADTQVETVSM